MAKEGGIRCGGIVRGRQKTMKIRCGWVNTERPKKMGSGVVGLVGRGKRSGWLPVVRMLGRGRR